MKANTIMTALEQFRAQKDTFFKTHPQSPLLPEQQNMFEGLRYFPENPALRLVVPIEEFVDKDRIVMQTSTGDVREYTRYGRLWFSVDGQAAELTLYADGDTYFLPFADALAGEETYGAGRYLGLSRWARDNSWSTSTWPITRIAPTLLPYQVDDKAHQRATEDEPS
jgi:uncharacterized protein